MVWVRAGKEYISVDLIISHPLVNLLLPYFAMYGVQNVNPEKMISWADIAVPYTVAETGCIISGILL